MAKRTHFKLPENISASATLPFDLSKLSDVKDPVVLRGYVVAAAARYVEADKRAAKEKDRADKAEKRERKAVQKMHKYKTLAEFDDRTGLHNDRYARTLQALLHRTGPYTVIAIDLDKFKQTNDRYGHQAGNAVLYRVARILEDCVQRDTDVACREGGDEFKILLPKLNDPIKAIQIAEKIRRRINESGDLFGVTASIGVAVSHGTERYPSANTISHRADLASYASKRAGKNMVSVWNTKEMFNYIDGDLKQVSMPTGKDLKKKAKIEAAAANDTAPPEPQTPKAKIPTLEVGGTEPV